MIRTEERGRVAIVRIDRHEQRNALDTEHCELLRDALKKAGVEVIFHVVKGAGHGFGGPEIDGRVDDFFDRHFRGREVRDQAGRSER